jgi:pre-mRNA-splicing factor SPF27
MEWQELCQKNIAIQAACVDLQNQIDQVKLEAKELYVHSIYTSLPPSLSLSLQMSCDKILLNRGMPMEDNTGTNSQAS